MRIRRFLAALVATVAVGAVAALTAGAHVPHTVEPGESLWSIAAANGLGVEALAAANGLSPETQLNTGSTVQIPPASSVGVGVPDTGIAGTGACVWRCASTAHPHPTDEVVSTGAITDVAGEYGMSPSLVEAIAWEESGFDNSVVSEGGARGVMQIIPDTWDFVNGQLVDESLSTVSAAANVEAGAAYLHHLYHVMGGDPEATIGSYFQGPNRDSVLPETREYVDEVLETKAEFEAGGG